MRSFNAGILDCYDYVNIAHGSNCLTNIEDGVYCREWKDQNGNNCLIKGLFDSNHPDPRSKYVRENIHILGFVHESDYTENELSEKIKLFYNPLLTSSIYYFKHGRLG